MANHRPSGTAVFPASDDDDWNTLRLYAAVRKATLAALPRLPALGREKAAALLANGQLDAGALGSPHALFFFAPHVEGDEATNKVRRDVKDLGGAPRLRSHLNACPCWFHSAAGSGASPIAAPI